MDAEQESWSPLKVGAGAITEEDESDNFSSILKKETYRSASQLSVRTRGREFTPSLSSISETFVAVVEPEDDTISKKVRFYDTAKETQSGDGKTPYTDKREVLISCIKYSLGLVNLWRFPFLAYENGGGAFVVSYLLLTVAVGIPIYYMELILGQYSRLSPTRVWSFCSFFRGLGPCVFFLCIIIVVYYNVLLGYAVFYLFEGIRRRLPWKYCYYWWGATANCYNKTGQVLCRKLDQNVPDIHYVNCSNANETPSEEFWRIYTVNLSSGIDDPGKIQWKLTLCLLSIWILTAIIVSRRFTFKRNRFTYQISCLIVAFAYVVMFFFFCFGLSLDGSLEGLHNLFFPQIEHMRTFKVWSQAAQQILYSLGVGMGGLIDYGNRNSFHHRIHRDAIIAALVTSLTAILSATIVFCVVGFISRTLVIPFYELDITGQFIAIIAYSESTVQTWHPRAASLCFFGMMVLISIDASADITSVVVHGMETAIPTLKKRPVSTILGVCFCMFLIGLCFLTQGGLYVLNIFDTYGGIAILGTTMFEVIAFAWVYGVRSRVCDDLARMTEKQPSLYMQACWLFLAPLTLIVLFFSSFFKTQLTDLYGKTYPSWAYFFGWTVTGLPLIQVPIWMVIVLFRNRQDPRKAFEPEENWPTRDKSESDSKSIRKKYQRQ